MINDMISVWCGYVIGAGSRPDGSPEPAHIWPRVSQKLVKGWLRAILFIIISFDGKIWQNTTFCRSKHKFSRTDFTSIKTVSTKLLIMGLCECPLSCHILDCQVTIWQQTATLKSIGSGVALDSHDCTQRFVDKNEWSWLMKMKLS